MSQTEKSELYNELKAAGVKLEKPYREYTTDELQEQVDRLHEQEGYQHDNAIDEVAAEAPSILPPVAERNEDVTPSDHSYSRNDEEPIRTDPDTGYVWYREEVAKPAIPSPRKRRVITYVDSGTETKTVMNGSYIETFEVAGTQQRRSEVKITMPSYQVGIYKDPRFPFKIHVYSGNRGFDLFDVQDFYGGSDLVPAEIKRIYVGSDLCYDIRTTIRAIETEARRLQLKGMNL